jgi:cell division septal protein FtsQ
MTRERRPLCGSGHRLEFCEDMEIKTNSRRRETVSARIIPPPDSPRNAHKKATNKLGKGHIAGRRLAGAFKSFGKLGAFLLIVLFMLSVFVYAYTSDKFNLQTVTFQGCKESNPKRLEEVIRQNFPANILRINLDALKSRLEKEPWVRRVEIRRILPSNLVIRVLERIPSAIVEFRGDLMLADQDGIMLGRYDPRYGRLDMPVFKGVTGADAEDYLLYQEENAARIRKGLQMLAEIEAGAPQQTKKISEVDISDPENLKILLVNDTVEIFLGEKDYLRRFRTLMENMGKYQELKDQYTEIESIDMRMDHEIIYSPKHAGVEHKSKT